MQSFHRSRGRILFEVFCAFAIAESCVGAWKQTGAWALLPAAVVAALYGVVHAFDLIGRKPAVAASVPALEREAIVAPAPVEEPTAENNVEVAVTAEEAPSRATRARRPKAAPKGSRRRGAARDEKIVEVAEPEDVQVAATAPTEEPRFVEIAPPEEPKAAEVTPPEPNVTPLPQPEETPPIPLTPLFEPEPFVRQQRAVFGRKS
jgi:hypothetical protein